MNVPSTSEGLNCIIPPLFRTSPHGYHCRDGESPYNFVYIREDNGIEIGTWTTEESQKGRICLFKEVGSNRLKFFRTFDPCLIREDEWKWLASQLRRVNLSYERFIQRAMTGDPEIIAAYHYLKLITGDNHKLENVFGRVAFATGLNLEEWMQKPWNTD